MLAALASIKNASTMQDWLAVRSPVAPSGHWQVRPTIWVLLSSQPPSIQLLIAWSMWWRECSMPLLLLPPLLQSLLPPLPSSILLSTLNLPQHLYLLWKSLIRQSGSYQGLIAIWLRTSSFQPLFLSLVHQKMPFMLHIHVCISWILLCCLSVDDIHYLLRPEKNLKPDGNSNGKPIKDKQDSLRSGNLQRSWTRSSE